MHRRPMTEHGRKRSLYNIRPSNTYPQLTFSLLTIVAVAFFRDLTGKKHVDSDGRAVYDDGGFCFCERKARVLLFSFREPVLIEEHQRGHFPRRSA